MPTFPALKTGALAQYPLEVSTRLRTQTVVFLDGSRQSYSLQGKPLRRWTIQLDMLDDTELAAIAEFANQSGNGTFQFIDPLTGEMSAKCILAGGAFESAVASEMRTAAALEIQEVL